MCVYVCVLNLYTHMNIVNYTKEISLYYYFNGDIFLSVFFLPTYNKICQLKECSLVKFGNHRLLHNLTTKYIHVEVLLFCIYMCVCVCVRVYICIIGARIYDGIKP